jgi:PAS domain S-box-containing protein
MQQRRVATLFNLVDTFNDIPQSEDEASLRLEALSSYGILDTPREQEYNEIAAQLASVCETPIAMVNFLAENRQWFKAEVGMGVRETPLDISVCRHTVLYPGLFIIPDTKEDPRFANSPLVTGDPHMRFYAGIPLKTPQGVPIGTLCVLDRRPRVLKERDGELMRSLARRVMDKLETRRRRNRSWHEKQLAATIDGALDCIVSINASGRIIDFNPAAERTFGYLRRDVVGEKLVEKIVPPECRERFEEALRRQVQTSNPLPTNRLDVPALRADGRQIVVEASLTLSGTPTHPVYIGFLRDITRTRQAEQIQSRYSRALHLLSACNDALLRVNREPALLQQICRHAVEIGGYRMAWIGYAQNDAARTVKPLAHAGHEEGYLSLVNISWSPQVPEGRGVAGRAIREGVPVIAPDFEKDPLLEPWQDAARERNYRSVICLPLMGEGRHFGLLALYSGESYQAQPEELKLLNELAENLATGIMTLRAREEQAMVQQAVLAIAQTISASGGEGFFQELTEGMTEALKADAGFISLYVSPQSTRARFLAACLDGTRPVLPLYDTAFTPCHQVKPDATSVVPHGLPGRFPHATPFLDWKMDAYVGIALLDEEGVPIGIMGVLFHQPIEKVGFIRSTLQIFATRVGSEIARQRDDARIREQASLLDRARDAILVRDCKHRITYWNKSAELLYGWKAEDVKGWLAPEIIYRDTARYYEAMDQLVLQGEWSGELEQVNREGRTLTVDSRWTLMRDDKGEPEAVLVINTDISEKKKLEAQFLRAQRVESIGTLASGIAHDLNNVLSPILMATDLLCEKISDEDNLATLAKLRSSAQHGAELVKQVVSFARGVEGRREPVDPNRLVRDVHKIVADTFPRNIEFRFNPGCALWSVTGDRTQLYQVLLNLCVNARDAMPNGGTISLAVENVILDRFYADRHPDSRPGAYVAWKVSDTGTGIPAGILNKIFDPFFTTKEVGKGTGLGLSTSLTIVRSHQGFINFSSEEGKGTTFEVMIPAGGSLTAAGVGGGPSFSHGNGKLLLVVEDEENLRAIMGETLQRFGYRVLPAADGAAGLDLYVRHAGEIALVVTDMMMPVMNGHVMIDALRQINPNIAIVISSAWALSGKVMRRQDVRLTHFMVKPYTVEKMLETIEKALAEVHTA